jgi:hypothetical protein
MASPDARRDNSADADVDVDVDADATAGDGSLPHRPRPDRPTAVLSAIVPTWSTTLLVAAPEVTP